MIISRFNLQSLLFAAIVLVLVLTGNHGTGDEFGISDSGEVGETSLTASVSGVLEDVAQPTESHIQLAAFGSQAGIIDFIKPDVSRLNISLPSVNAEAVLVKEIGSPFVLYEENMRKRWPLASITKLMTAVVALEKFGPSAEVSITDTALAAEGIAGYFSLGERFTVIDLLRATLGISSNDAATALAESNGYDEFIRSMQSRATSLGMPHTSFFDSTGISSLNQSTLHDMERLVKYILKEHPNILAMTAVPSSIIIDLTTGAERIIPTNNEFAGRKYFIGGKTGYTDDARGNLISVFEYDSRPFIIGIFGTEDRFEETEKLRHWLYEHYIEI